MLKSKAVSRGLVQAITPYWDSIRKAAASSIGMNSRGFIPGNPLEEILGCGFWGCVWPTADKRFVLKASLDATEGPHVAIAMRDFQKHKGLAYFHGLWRLPEMIWTDEFGYAYVWIMLREAVDVDSQYSRNGVVAHGYAKVSAVLEELPDCCSCLLYAGINAARGCSNSDVKAQEKELYALLAKLRDTRGTHVGKLISDVYRKHGHLIGDVHFDNVGGRVHDMSEFGVAKHKKLVVTDLGSWGQSPITIDRYPKVKVLGNPQNYDQIANSIPVLP